MRLHLYIAGIILLLFVNGINAQITTEPAFPIANENVRIIFDSNKDSRLGYFTQDLYAHTGVGIEGEGNWQYVIEGWGNNNTQPKLTYLGDGKYELLITPDIHSFYGVPTSEKIINISFVFRSSNSNQQTNDLFVEVYETGLNLDMTFPTLNAILETGQSYNFEAQASSTASLKFYIDNELAGESTGESIIISMSFNVPGDHIVKVTAETSEGQYIADSTFICVMGETPVAALPNGAKKGISYPDEQSARLVLWAPGKEFVFLLGDFNNWRPQNQYLMKKDGDYFWLEIPRLESGKEYIFQYFVDGEIRIADPYAEKISDPWSDDDISSSTYPGLIAYPEGKTEGIASVLQPGQEPYAWEVENFEMPPQENLVIYELLIRDFTSEHTYQSVIDKLDYLEQLGINVLELMPVNEFEGNISWGYNPAFYFAPDKYYGPKNDLKKLVDECHIRGIAVVIDMVLNHSFGQSPFVRMYWNEAAGRPAADNPWYNETSPNQTYSWGYDFNHDSEYTLELVDSVNSFWMSEYKVDGFRFDFTKGFTNTPGDGWAYDADRIAILKRMADEMWKRKPGSLVICEHLADNNEEKELANHGLLLWGNINHNYGEAAMGYVQASNSNLSWGLYKQRAWNAPNLVTYQESHDEERLTFKCLTWGNASGEYNTKELETALKRMELNAVFHLPLPGPKMIWQFGELGYDYSINTCDDGVTINNDCRLAMKPIKWNYRNNANRANLFRVMASLNFIKHIYEEFSTADFSYSLTGAQKRYTLSAGENHVVAVGNFALEEATVSVTFPKTGNWYNYFGESEFNVSQESMDITLAAGEYFLLSTREFEHPEISISAIEAIKLTEQELKVFPNPAESEINISGKSISTLVIFDMKGHKVKTVSMAKPVDETTISVEGLHPGLYIIQCITTNKIVSGVFFLKE
ncbi:MAG: T9SS type A sorting domain-containing protein [Prolixibacteraceae bacterium]|nr:T9SS type A sorting domain-containing protein [Prolixibacteraceae bacterium]